MTEEEIEIWVERQIDRIDSRYIRGQLTTEEYEIEMQGEKDKAKQMERLSHQPLS
jgi:hypothetical protein